MRGGRARAIVGKGSRSASRRSRQGEQPPSLKMKATAKFRAIALGTVIAVGLLLCLLVVAVAFDWVEIKGGQPPSKTLDAPTAGGTQPTAEQEGKTPWPFEGFPLQDYTSFEEAERVAGYHIVRPSAEYPVSFGRTHLQWFPQFDRPLSTTEYTFPPLAPTSIGVIVNPNYANSKHDRALPGYHQTEVGGRAGWLKEGDLSWFFDFSCGEIDGHDLLCSVNAVKEIGWDAFEHFVSTLQ
jgi:hypothetical protein